MAAALDDRANATALLVGGVRMTLLLAPFGRGRAGTGQFPQPGQLGLQLPGFLLQLQDPADAGQVQAVGGQCADFLEPADVPAGVPAGAARAARRVQQRFPFDRQGDNFYICLDLPGVTPESIDLTVEQNVLTVRADRAPAQADGAQLIVAERPYGTFTRQGFLGETLDADHVVADYAAGVLTLTIPVREAAKPRSI